jgi:hypothetical protein
LDSLLLWLLALLDLLARVEPQLPMRQAQEVHEQQAVCEVQRVAQHVMPQVLLQQPLWPVVVVQVVQVVQVEVLVLPAVVEPLLKVEEQLVAEVA